MSTSHGIKDIKDSDIKYDDYFEVEDISETTKGKLGNTDIVIVPSRYQEHEYYFAQETIDFLKYCKQKDSTHSYDILADGDIRIRSLHSFDIWMPVIWVAQNILLPIAFDMVWNYIKEKRKGRKTENANVDVIFVVKTKGKEKLIHYNGSADTFKETFEKIDANCKCKLDTPVEW